MSPEPDETAHDFWGNTVTQQAQLDARTIPTTYHRTVVRKAPHSLGGRATQTQTTTHMRPTSEPVRTTPHVPRQETEQIVHARPQHEQTAGKSADNSSNTSKKEQRVYIYQQRGVDPSRATPHTVAPKPPRRSTTEEPATSEDHTRCKITAARNSSRGGKLNTRRTTPTRARTNARTRNRHERKTETHCKPHEAREEQALQSDTSTRPI